MTNEEFWKPVVGYEGLYEVSNLGRVKRLSFNGRPQKRPSIAKGSFRQGYSIVGLTKEHKTKVAGVHRLVAEAFLGPAPEGKPLVCHKDGSRTNNVPENLYWGDAEDNAQDALRHGRHFFAGKSHCKRGHEFTEVNTRQLPAGGRSCKACETLRSALPEARAKKNAHERLQYGRGLRRVRTLTDEQRRIKNARQRDRYHETKKPFMAEAEVGESLDH